MEKLIERQLRDWEFARQKQLAESPEVKPETADFVCISRMPGSGGGKIAARVGEQLGWPVFDKQILHMMAGDDVMREQIYRSLDERDLGWFEETFLSLMQSEYRRNDYFHRLVETILCLARQGSGVFVGRGADLILPRDRGLRVRIVAPLDWRIANYTNQHAMTPEQASEEVARIEKERADYIRQHFHVDVNEPTRVDLTINRVHFTTDQAAHLIVHTFKEVAQKAPPQSPVASPVPARRLA